MTIYNLPRPQAQLADRAGLPMREWYDFWSGLSTLADQIDGLAGQETILAAVVARVLALEQNPTRTRVQGVGSVQASGLDPVLVSLIGDADAPGANRYYGTDAAGSKGFYVVPVLSNATPQDLGTAAAGVGLEASRSDHVHKIPAPSDLPGFQESVEDIIGASVISGSSNVTVAYDDPTGKTSVAVTAAAAPGVTYSADLTSVVDADPGPGKLRWNNASQASATVLFLDDLTADARSMTGVWAGIVQGGLLYLQNPIIQGTWQLWKITAITTVATYVKLGVTLLAKGTDFAANGPIVAILQTGAAAAALVNWVESISTTAPNTPTSAVSFAAIGAATNIDAVVSPKGTGALLAQVPDSTATAGNKRGARAVDWQSQRQTAAQVASGANSFIGNGERNSATQPRSGVVCGISGSATGQNAIVGGGNTNTASGTDAFVGAGNTNTASGLQSGVGSGQSGLASGICSFVVNGREMQATGAYSTALSGMRGTTRGVAGSWVHGMVFSTGLGAIQAQGYLLSRQTTDATATLVTSDSGTTAIVTNQIILPNNSAYLVSGRVLARQATTGDIKTFTFEASITRGATAATTAIFGTPAVGVTSMAVGADMWQLTFAADTTLGALRINVSGDIGKTITWNVHVFSCVQIAA